MCMEAQCRWVSCVKFILPQVEGECVPWWEGSWRPELLASSATTEGKEENMHCCYTELWYMQLCLCSYVTCSYCYMQLCYVQLCYMQLCYMDLWLCSFVICAVMLHEVQLCYMQLCLCSFVIWSSVQLCYMQLLLYTVTIPVLEPDLLLTVKWELGHGPKGKLLVPAF